MLLGLFILVTVAPVEVDPYKDNDERLAAKDPGES